MSEQSEVGAEVLHEPMTRPHRFLVRMAVCVAVVALLGALLWPRLQDAFLANLAINGTIVAVLLLGILFIFRQVMVLTPELAWIEAFRRGRSETSNRQPDLLAPMATMLGGGPDEEQPRLSPVALRSLLDGIASRLDERRDLARYLIGLLVFLGLLGTFWGLLGTIAGVAQAIEALRVDADADAAVMFEALKAGLGQPLDGMATAFSSSLFGLAGSLILGFLELQAAQAQSRFYNELEEWLSSLTRLRLGGGGPDETQAVPEYIAALLEQTADNLRRLEKTTARGEDERLQTQKSLDSLVDALTGLTGRLERQDGHLATLGDAQKGLTVALAELADTVSRMSGAEEGNRDLLRSLDQRLARLLEDQAAGRSELSEALASEVRVLAKSLSGAGTTTRKRSTPSR